MMIGHNKKRSGFTLVEMMIFIFIFSITSITFYRGLTSGTKAMSNVKQRLDALAVANEKMEIIHNLDYEKIGTQHGAFTGEIPDEENFVQDNRNYKVYTSVNYVDDPFDGLAVQGNDSKPNDYKQIKITVYWVDNDPSKSVTLTSIISPPGMESIYTGGILSLHVVDNNGNGISGASVHITNNNLSPIVDLPKITDENGNVFIIEARASSESYHITVSKIGYFPVQTYAPYPTSSVLPVDVDASVVESNINQKTIVTDMVSSIKIKTKTILDADVQNIEFGLKGGRKIADTVDSNSVPVFAYDEQSLATDSNGEKNISDLSSGPYELSYKNSTSNSNYEFLYVNPSTNKANNFDLSAGIDQEETIILADKNLDSLLATIVDAADLSPIANANVQLKNADGSYDVILQTNKFGQVYFPDPVLPLVAGTYSIKITADGFQEKEQTININKLTKQTINLNAN